MCSGWLDISEKKILKNFKDGGDEGKRDAGKLVT